MAFSSRQPPTRPGPAGDVSPRAAGSDSARHDPAAVLARLSGGPRAARLRHIERLPGRRADLVELPPWTSPVLRAALSGAGVSALWSHQRQAADLAHSGEHVVMATGTASGKSLGYLLPALSASLDQGPVRGATTIYLAPTKALAADQLAKVEALALPGLRAATYDGDTARDERRWIRDHAHLVLTNPDLLHHSLLPGHERWAGFLRALRFVVVDECHVYRGVFGSHVALVMRRLQRVAARYGSRPTFVLASATVSRPADHASRLIGMPVTPVVEDGSPREPMTFGLWEPPEREGTRRSATAEAADLLADLVRDGVQTVAFARSRAGVETLAAAADRRLQDIEPGMGGRVAAYRGGYLPEERRLLEHRLRRGELVGLAATSALELGVDIAGLDAVLLAGWPGRHASLWQRAGRAGRAGAESLAVLVADDDPLDRYLVEHPEAVFGQVTEASVLDPDNPHVLAPHLAAAAAELPLTREDLTTFGPGAGRLLDVLVERGILRRRPSGWYWARPDRATDHVSLRGTTAAVNIVEARTGRLVGTVDEASAHSQAHTGAVLLHQGEGYVVTHLDLEKATALVVRGDPGWSTQARSVSAFDLAGDQRIERHGPLQVGFGPVHIRTQVTSFHRRGPGGEIIGTHPLDLPERTLRTLAVWWTLTEESLAAAGVPPPAVPGAAHAAEHGAIGMLPLVAACDRWDIGGVSTALHPDTGAPTILVYDGHPGGAGFVERAAATFRQWLTATHAAITSCGCATGCPGCVQSPKCGNGNEPLDKAGAIALLGLTLALLPEER